MDGGIIMFMKGFNSLQLTVLFAAWPFLCEWVKTATFAMSGPLFWIMCIAYVIGFVGMVMAVYDTI